MAPGTVAEIQRAASTAARTEFFAGGALLFAWDADGEAFILLGLERRSGKGWSYMVGKVDAGERTLAACAREMHEETGGIYSISRDALKRLPCLACDQQLLFLVPCIPVNESTLNDLASMHFEQGRFAFGEMQEYLWVSLKDLRAQPKQSVVTVNTMDGSRRVLHLRSFVPRALEKAERRGLLALVADHKLDGEPLLPKEVKIERRSKV